MDGTKFVAPYKRDVEIEVTTFECAIVRGLERECEGNGFGDDILQVLHNLQVDEVVVLLQIL